MKNLVVAVVLLAKTINGVPVYVPCEDIFRMYQISDSTVELVRKSNDSPAFYRGTIESASSTCGTLL